MDALSSHELKERHNPHTSDGSEIEVLPSRIPRKYLVGWRHHLLLLCVCLSIFLPNLEVSIVSTALVDIANDLQGFSRTGWVIVSYLTTYTAFIIVWAKLSDIAGRKLALTLSLIVFTVFSAGCGATANIIQLIVCRALQGIGAAGCFSVAMVVVFELGPKDKYPLYGSIVSADVALATLLGPILGGLISEKTSWRWVFLLNVPAGLVTVLLLIIAMPAGFPHLDQPSRRSSTFNMNLSINSLSRIDVVGTLLFLAASFLFVTSLLETSRQFSWNSPVTISLLTLSGVLAILFLLWERYLTLSAFVQEPIFPWRFVHNRAWMGMIFASLFLGIPFAVLIVNIPQKYQIVHNLSPLAAGIRLLPYALPAPFGSFISNGLTSRFRNITPVYLVLVGAGLQVLGLGLIAGYSTHGDIGHKQYGFEAIAGFGLGMSFGTLALMTPSAVEPQDLATATGAMVQFRQFGSTVGLSIASSLMNGQLTSKLSSVLSPSQLSSLLENSAAIHQFPTQLQLSVKQVFVGGYSLQLKVIVAFAAAEFLFALLILKRNQIKAR